MKNIKLFIISILFIGTSNILAQETKQVQVHESQTSKQLNIGLFGVSYDIPVHKNIMVAPVASFALDFDWFSFGVRGDYYFDNLLNLPAPWDVYAGAGVGYAISMGNNNASSDMDFDGRIGGRWFWDDKWGIFLEFGGGHTTKIGGGLGVTMKL